MDPGYNLFWPPLRLHRQVGQNIAEQGSPWGGHHGHTPARRPIYWSANDPEALDLPSVPGYRLTSVWGRPVGGGTPGRVSTGGPNLRCDFR